MLTEEVCAEFRKNPNHGFVGVGTCGNELLILAVPGCGVREQLREAGFEREAEYVLDSSSRFQARPRDVRAITELETGGYSALRPPTVRPGHYCARPQGCGGTVGCILEDPPNPTNKFFLTVEHALWPHDPSSTLVETANGHPIGEIRDRSDILHSTNSDGDWALVELTKATGAATPWCSGQLTFLPHSDPSPNLDGQCVEKCGNATRRRQGQVCAADWCAAVEYQCDKISQLVWFDCLRRRNPTTYSD